VSKITLKVVVNVDDKQVEKFNLKRKRLGRVPSTALDWVVDALSEGLWHNLMFDRPKVYVITETLTHSQPDRDECE